MTRQAPFRPKGEYLYTILDRQAGVRGPTNFIGNGWDVTSYPTAAIGWRALHIALLSNSVEISRRQQISMDIVEVKRGAAK